MMRSIALVLVGSFSLLAAAEPAGPAKTMGDSWEVTSQMSMEGAPVGLPGRAGPAFAPDDAPAPPARTMGGGWEVPSQMAMEGAPTALPGRTVTVCAPKDQPPVQADER